MRSGVADHIRSLPIADPASKIVGVSSPGLGESACVGIGHGKTSYRPGYAFGCVWTYLAEAPPGTWGIMPTPQLSQLRILTAHDEYEKLANHEGHRLRIGRSVLVSGDLAEIFNI